MKRRERWIGFCSFSFSLLVLSFLVSLSLMDDSLTISEGKEGSRVVETRVSEVSSLWGNFQPF